MTTYMIFTCEERGFRFEPVLQRRPFWFYRGWGTIEASDLEDAHSRLQGGVENAIAGRRMRSLSVGDMLREFPSEEFWAVDRVGFRRVFVDEDDYVRPWETRAQYGEDFAQGDDLLTRVRAWVFQGGSDYDGPEPHIEDDTPTLLAEVHDVLEGKRCDRLRKDIARWFDELDASEGDADEDLLMDRGCALLGASIPVLETEVWL